MPTLLFLTLTPETARDQDALVRGLETLHADGWDASIHWHDDAVTLGTSDNEQLDLLIDRLKREFGVHAMVSRPAVDVRRAWVDTPSGPVLVDVEPWMEVEIHSPKFYVPRILAAFPGVPLQSVDADGHDRARLRAFVPLARILGLRTVVKALSHGRAEASVTFVRYAPRDDDEDAERLVRVRT